MLDLAALELGEREVDARASLALGAIDLLGDRVLVLSKTLVQLVDRPAPVVGLQLQLVERAGERVAVLDSRSSWRRTAAARCSPIVVSSSSASAATLPSTSAMRWRMRCSSVGHRALEGVLGSLEIGLPGPQPLLHALLDGRHELGHPLGELSLANRELAAALVGEAAFLRDVRRERVGLRAGDRHAELLGLCGGLLVGRCPNRSTCLGHELLRANRPRSRAPQRQ